jgi:hypothetical protein
MSLVLPPGLQPRQPPPLELYDHEMRDALEVLETLRRRAGERPRNYNDFEREIIERFEDIGLTVHVNWYSYAANRVVQTGSALPEVTITGRTDPTHVFDPDRQVHEVTSNILGLPEEDAEIIRTDAGESFRRYQEGQHDHGHGHGHSHPH